MSLKGHLAGFTKNSHIFFNHKKRVHSMSNFMFTLAKVGSHFILKMGSQLISKVGSHFISKVGSQFIPKVGPQFIY